MPVGTSAQLFLLFLREQNRFRLLHQSRKRSTHKDFTVVITGIIRRVHISDVSLCRIRHHSSIGFMQYDADGQRHCLFQIGIRNNRFVQMRTRVQRNHTCFDHAGVSPYHQRMIHQPHSET